MDESLPGRQWSAAAIAHWCFSRVFQPGRFSWWLSADGVSEGGNDGSGYDVFLDPLHPRDVLGGDAHRLPFIFGAVIGKPEMDNPVADADVRAPHVDPFMSLEFGEQFCPNSPVVVVGDYGWLALGHRQCPHQV